MIHTLEVDGPWGVRRIDCGRDELVLDALIRHEVPVAYCCKAGLCGMCKAVVTTGSFERLPSSPRALSEDDAACGKILTCCAKPSSDASLRPLATLEAGGSGQRAVLATASSCDAGPALSLLRLKLAGAADAAGYAPGHWARLRRLDADDEAGLGCFVSASGEEAVFALQPGSGEFAARLAPGDRVVVDGPLGSPIDTSLFAHPVAIAVDSAGLPLLPALVRAAGARSAPVAPLLLVVHPLPLDDAALDAVSARQLRIATLEAGAPVWRQEFAALAAQAVAAGTRLRVLVRGTPDFQMRLRRLLAGTGIRAWDLAMENALDLGQAKQVKDTETQ